MVGRTLPFRPRDKPKPDEPLPRQIEADQKDVKKQLKHAQQQLDLSKVYPGRRGDTGST